MIITRSLPADQYLCCTNYSSMCCAASSNTRCWVVFTVPPYPPQNLSCGPPTWGTAGDRLEIPGGACRYTNSARAVLPAFLTAVRIPIAVWAESRCAQRTIEQSIITESHPTLRCLPGRCPQILVRIPYLDARCAELRWQSPSYHEV